ncbi:phage gene 29 protein family protein [Rhodococcoides fascians]|uniref:phage gene 29 protein family protein n=1 Tax=Rhodococcoides fascians TaxID=1828 RepID=UPI00068CA25F|nr:DUF2744 domain-containing protein [Rhodococcus fascians]
MALPQQENSDLESPEGMFAWMMLGLPGIKGAPMPFHPTILAMWSAHFYKCGARFHPDLQEIEFHPPTRGDHHWLNVSGSWKEVGLVKEAHVNATDMSDRTATEKGDMVRQLLETGELAQILSQMPENIAAARPVSADDIADLIPVDDLPPSTRARATTPTKKPPAKKAAAAKKRAAPRKKTPPTKKGT